MVVDYGLSLSLQAIRRQLAAMPASAYLIRLIHFDSRRPFPGERLWTASQILAESRVRFLRARNREGFDVYFRPDAGDQNAGYILVDLDEAPPTVLTAMRANGHEPCVVVQTSPGHLQAWLHISDKPLAPGLATQIARHLARLYHGDRASADWRHVGRLAGFTNRKPKRKLPNGWPPWVRVQEAQPCLTSDAGLMATAWQIVPQAAHRCAALHKNRSGVLAESQPSAGYPAMPAAAATAIYQSCLADLRIPQRFARPDWSIADLWVAKALLMQGMADDRVKAILRSGSPGFPRSHSDPEDYLRRTLARALQHTMLFKRAPFPARPFAFPVG